MILTSAASEWRLMERPRTVWIYRRVEAVLANAAAWTYQYTRHGPIYIYIDVEINIGPCIYLQVHD